MATSGDGLPASWLTVERGWRVVGPDGTVLGRVHDVVGDPGIDIFDGLAIAAHGHLHHRYVPAERVVSISDGSVHVSIGPDDVEGLSRYRTPPATFTLE